MASRVDCVAITMHNTSPVAVSRVIDEGGQVCFGARELYDKLVAGTVSWPTWRDTINGGCLLCCAWDVAPGVPLAATCHSQQLVVASARRHAQSWAAPTTRRRHAGVHSSFTRAATHPERAALTRLGSIKPRAPKALLVSRSTAVRACGRLSLHNTVVSSLGGVCADTPALDMAALQPPAPAAGGGQAGSTATPQSQPAPPPLLLPKHLPACTVAASQLHDRYGLRECSPTMLLHGPLADQLEAMQSWCTRPVQLDRPGRPLNPRTWRNLLDGMTLYLGFLHKHQGLTQPMLEEYLSPTSFSQFMAFQLARSCGAIHVGRQVRCRHAPPQHAHLTQHLPCLPCIACPRTATGLLHAPALQATAEPQPHHRRSASPARWWTTCQLSSRGCLCPGNSCSAGTAA